MDFDRGVGASSAKEEARKTDLANTPWDREEYDYG